ncbi:MAG: hypothetical protein LBU91_01250 [Bacteroidales bacterium]|jgi:hypothetical protein|nr:hypothetical protein [Bacteroidales bacterium]
MKLKFIILQLFVANSVFAQLPQLRPEVVELYRLQDIAKQSRILNSDDIVEKHEAFFNHPLFDEIAFGIEYINLAEVLLIQGEREKAENYFLKAAQRLEYISTSNRFESIFDKRATGWSWDTVFLIPRTPENIRFKERVLEKILRIEKKRIVDPRIMSIAQELEELKEKDQAIRWVGDPSFSDFSSGIDSATIYRIIELTKKNFSKKEVDSIMRVVDSSNIYRIIELIKENPDIDILRVIRGRSENPTALVLWHTLRLKVRYARVAWLFFEPYFRKQAENGKGLEYCYWYDAYCWHIKADLAYYGVYSSEGDTEDIKQMNERREKVGLLPLSR